MYCCVLNVMLHNSLPTTKETLYLIYDSLILKPGSGSSLLLAHQCKLMRTACWAGSSVQRPWCLWEESFLECGNFVTPARIWEVCRFPVMHYCQVWVYHVCYHYDVIKNLNLCYSCAGLLGCVFVIYQVWRILERTIITTVSYCASACVIVHNNCYRLYFRGCLLMLWL